MKKTAKKPEETSPSILGPSEKLLSRSGFLLNKAAQKIREAYEEVLRPTGLSAKHAGVLVNLADKGHVSQHELGKCGFIDRTTIVGLIDDLEKLGLVERKKHPLDRRSHMIYLTTRGRDLLPVVDKHSFEIERKFLDCLSAPEQKSLIQILRKLVLSHYNESKESR